MTIDARTASPEPSLHAATLLSRTRLTQLECAARLGISERTLRYHLTGRPMSYALRCLFEGLARGCETANHPFLQGTAPSKKRVIVADLLNPSALSPFLTMPTDGGTEYLPEVGPPRRFLHDALDAIGPCRLEIQDLTCAEAANPWARMEAMREAVEGDLPFTGSLHNQFLGRVNREGRVTEQTIMHGADIYRRTSDGYEWVDCEPSHPESVVFHFVRTGEKRTMRKVKRDGTA